METCVSFQEPFPKLNFIIFEDRSFKQRQQMQASTYPIKKFWSNEENQILSDLIESYGYKPTKISQFIKTRDVKQVISHIQKINHRLDSKNIADFQEKGVQQNELIQNIYSMLYQSGYGAGVLAHYISHRYKINFDLVLQVCKQN
ncbi:hypothetical protein SS50377_20462 [Spironucleus salmonicida]|uniref:Myb-like DNA-binding domain-containing protein n=1 Tax=Spironucleus salmonicida TaxID=348837 RepID=V6LLS6_9EUKA|nr:hypothetical protein SS50377_20462 [Spironucleus salmonicida]|eukprot:EST45612.1 Myb-like DNA-binding domain-containing protein [Spironucleus salmonicida]